MTVLTRPDTVIRSDPSIRAESPPTVPLDRPTPPSRVWLRRLAPAAVYLFGQLLTLRVLASVGADHGERLTDLLNSWDAKHLMGIAADGYADSVQSGVLESPAFFPGFPTALRFLSSVTGLSLPVSGLVLSLGSGVALAYGLVRVAGRLRGAREWTGLIWVALVAVGPLSIVLAMTYTESLFCALAVWCLVAVLEERWLLAGIASLAAGLVRPTGLALAGAVVIAAAVAVIRKRGTVAPLVGALIAPIGTVGYILWVGASFGRLSAYFEAQVNGWGTEFDFGRGTLAFIGRSLDTAPAVLDIAVVVVVAAALVLLGLLIRQRQPVVLLVYGALALLSDIGSDGVMNSKIRLMIPAFVLLIPLAVWLGRQARGIRFTALGCYALAGLWYSAHGLIIYQYAI